MFRIEASGAVIGRAAGKDDEVRAIAAHGREHFGANPDGRPILIVVRVAVLLLRLQDTPPVAPRRVESPGASAR